MTNSTTQEVVKIPKFYGANINESPIFGEVFNNDDDLYNMLSSPAIISLTDMVGSGKEKITKYIEDKKHVNHNQKIQISAKGTGENKSISITTTTKMDETVIDFKELDIIKKVKGPAGKILVYTLIKGNEQAIHNGEISRDYISYSLQDLVDVGLYNNKDSARKGFKESAIQILGIQISGTSKRGKKAPIVEGGGVLFINWKIKNGQCYLYMNPNFNWNFIYQYYTVLPKCYFEIPTDHNRASSLVIFISFLSRQRLKQIKEQGYFNISFKAIQNRLGLKDPSELKQPYRDIITDGILKAVNIALQYDQGKSWNIEPIFNPNDSLLDILENGYLKVTPKNNYKKRLTEYAEKVEKQIRKSIELREKRKEKALTMNLAKQIENKAAQSRP